jgi:alcohol dehydrogenase
MKALTYHGPGKKVWGEVPDRVIQDPTDIIVKVEVTTICGTDLHILKGDVPEMPIGTVIGHEAVGTVSAVGSAVRKHRVGDRVLVSCITSCGACSYCAKGMAAHCQNGGGWIFGHLIDGTQAEYIRVPHADNSAFALPEHVKSEDALMLSDIFPTGNEIGVLYGTVKAGDVVAVVGTGPVGLAAIMSAKLHGPSKIIAIDLDPNRIEVAKTFGATHGVLGSDSDWKEQVFALTDGLGVDVSMEVVGTPTTWDMSLSLLRPGGHLAVVGVHGAPVLFPVEKYWIENITITTGLVSAFSTADLLAALAAGDLDADKMVTHHFALNDIETAYEVFGNAAANKALKVVLHA